MRDECAPECQHVDKENSVGRDLCVHKCMSVSCYYKMYENFRLLNYDSLDQSAQDYLRETLRVKFLYCFESELPKEVNAQKYIRRLRTCQFKNSLELPYMTKMQTDEYIFKCINSSCYYQVFEHYMQDQNLSITYNLTNDEERKNLKDNFIDCVQKEYPTITSDYWELRTLCLQNHCQSIRKERKLERDMCVHGCIDKEC